MSWGVPPWNLPIHNFPIQCCIHDLRGRISGAQPQSWAVDVFCWPQWSMAWWHIWHGMDVPWPTMIRHDPSLPDVRVLYSAKKPRGALLNYSPPNQYDLRALGRSSTSSVIEMSFEILEIFVFIPSKLTKKNDLKSFPFCSSARETVSGFPLRTLWVCVTADSWCPAWRRWSPGCLLRVRVEFVLPVLLNP